jgi:flagellin
MSQTINTNLASLTAQRNSSKTQNELSTAINRLSSGLRINSAKDDAAGLAIAERFTAQIRGLNQAARNANDGISLAQVAEGALSSIGTNLQRIRELAIQSANSTNSASDRVALQQEVAQLVAEVDRVGVQTQFNGLNLLDGSFTAQQFQVGANANQTISVSGIASARASALGASYTASVTGGAVTATPLVAGALTLNGQSIQAAVAGSGNGQAADSAYAVAQAINASQGTVIATANATTVTGGNPAAAGAIAANAFTINGVNVGAIAAGADVPGQGANVAAAINLVSAASGVTATVAAGGAVTLTAIDGRNIVIAGTVTNTGLTAATTRGTVSLTTSSPTTNTGITIAGTAPANGGFTAATTAGALTGAAISVLDISSVAGANTALASVDAALTQINGERAKLGAIQNRFSSTIQNLQTSAENQSAARSRIQDADFAAETAMLSRAQVLQQAGTAMIAQANQLPQQVLQLLKG